jgi:hypothetical protein
MGKIIVLKILNMEKLFVHYLFGLMQIIMEKLKLMKKYMKIRK